VPCAFASRLAQDRDTPSCRATAVVLMPGVGYAYIHRMRRSDMAIVPVELTEDERKLLDRIEFDPLKIHGGVEVVAAVCQAAKALAQSLNERKAIPAHRLRFFTDPDYNIGGHGSSRKQLFERNSNGNDILTSVHFLKYLHYFIYGPSLSPTIIDGFQEKVKACGMVTSGDIIPLGEYAKKQVRTYTLKSSAEDFYKLALECGLEEYEARSIRDSVKKVR
jgi:hypothetical protein